MSAYVGQQRRSWPSTPPVKSGAGGPEVARRGGRAAFDEAVAAQAGAAPGAPAEPGFAAGAGAGSRQLKNQGILSHDEYEAEEKRVNEDLTVESWLAGPPDREGPSGDRVQGVTNLIGSEDYSAEGTTGPQWSR